MNLIKFKQLPIMGILRSISAEDLEPLLATIEKAGLKTIEITMNTKGPFHDIELLACGGVTPENMKFYFSNGANAVSFGVSVFRKEWLAQRKFQAIGREIEKFTREFGAHEGLRCH